MSSQDEDTHTVKSFTEHTDVIHHESSVGTKVGEGVHGAMNIVHGIGESIRGLAIDIADFGKGTGKGISEDGKAEVKQGVRKVEGSIHR